MIDGSTVTVFTIELLMVLNVRWTSKRPSISLFLLPIINILTFSLPRFTLSCEQIKLNRNLLSSNIKIVNQNIIVLRYKMTTEVVFSLLICTVIEAHLSVSLSILKL